MAFIAIPSVLSLLTFSPPVLSWSILHSDGQTSLDILDWLFVVFPAGIAPLGTIFFGYSASAAVQLAITLTVEIIVAKVWRINSARALLISVLAYTAASFALLIALTLALNGIADR